MWTEITSTEALRPPTHCKDRHKDRQVGGLNFSPCFLRFSVSYPPKTAIQDRWSLTLLYESYEWFIARAARRSPR
jgi:hypothetical protein